MGSGGGLGRPSLVATKPNSLRTIFYNRRRLDRRLPGAQIYRCYELFINDRHFDLLLLQSLVEQRLNFGDRLFLLQSRVAFIWTLGKPAYA